MNEKAIANLKAKPELKLAILKEAEADEMWSYVQNKKKQRWLWYVIDHNTKEILAYTLGTRKYFVFKKLKNLLKPFEIDIFYTDNWGAYSQNLDSEKHIIDKKFTQSIERKNLNFRTRIKRLTRKTICFSRSCEMHDIVIGLYINAVEFART